MTPVHKMSRDELESEVEYLRAQAGMTKDHDAISALKVRVGLTIKEASVLLALYRAGGRCLTKEAVMDAVYTDGIDDQPEMKIIDVFVCKLRMKIGADLIQTVWGLGYRLTDAGVGLCVAALNNMPLTLPERRYHPKPVLMGALMLAALEAAPLSPKELSVQFGWPLENVYGRASGLMSRRYIVNLNHGGLRGSARYAPTAAGLEWMRANRPSVAA